MFEINALIFNALYNDIHMKRLFFDIGHGLKAFISPSNLQNYNTIKNAYINFCLQHPEFSFMLKERVCPLVIKLFSPSLKYRQGQPPVPSPVPAEKPYFPIVMRLLRIVAGLIHGYYPLLVKFLLNYTPVLSLKLPHWNVLQT